MNSNDAFSLPGLTAATFTPMHPDGSLHLDAIGDVVDFLVRQGVSAMFVLGSTGEGLSLTTQERQEVAKAYVQASAQRLPVVIHVGHNCLEEAKSLARHAERIGASAISAIAPFYFKPANSETVVQCLYHIANGAPSLPFYYYHIPALTGLHIDLPALIRMCTDRLPTLAGIKYSDPELQACLDIMDQDSGQSLDFVFGVDEMLLSALTAGMRGAVGSTYNFSAPLYRRIIDCYEQGDLKKAQALQARAAAMIDLVLRICGPPGFKVLMSVIGVNCGSCRLPQASCARSDVLHMMNELEAIGFFEWGCAP